MTEAQAHGTHLRVRSESYSMNTNTTEFGWFSKIFAALCFWLRLPLSIGRVNHQHSTSISFIDCIEYKSKIL